MPMMIVLGNANCDPELQTKSLDLAIKERSRQTCYITEVCVFFFFAWCEEDQLNLSSNASNLSQDKKSN